MKPMKVKELIATLKTLDQNSYVAMSTDSEGNSYSMMSDEMFVTTECYLENRLGGQEQYFEDQDMKTEGNTVTDFYGNKHEKAKLVKSIILWPTN